MAHKLTRRQVDLLRHFATYRVLATDQAAVLQDVGAQAARKRLDKLMDLGLIEARSEGYGRARGRPNRIYYLTEQGIAHLKSLGLAPGQDSYDPRCPGGVTAANHQLLLNWCLLHLLHLERVHSQFKVGFVNHPHSLEMEEPSVPVEAPSDRSPVTIPDAIFSITCEEQSKTLLFFLEVDMATETVASPSRTNRDFRIKIRRYQEYFRSAAYTRYGDLWHCELRGFRLLVVTNSRARLASLSGLVREMRPSDFIWLTDQGSLFARGISAPVWVRGGHQDSLLQSIIGPTFARVAPLLPVRL